MLRGPMRDDWGVDMKDGQLTQCVRRFGVPKSNGRGILPNHVVATRMSQENSQDLIVSYSDGPICLFDINDNEPVTMVQPDGERRSKRPKRSVDSEDRHEEAEEVNDSVHVRGKVDTEEEEPGSQTQEAADRDGDQELEMSASAGDNEDDEDESEDERLPSFFAGLRRPPRPFHEDVPLIAPHQSYSGHANSATVKDVNFLSFGQDAHVMSGSDDGNWFVWDKATADLVAIYEGDSSVVNVLQAHPRLPIVAISGIDNTVKLFGPTNSVQHQSNMVSRRDEIVEANLTGDNANGRLRGNQLSAEDVLAIVMSRLPPGAALPRVRVRRRPLEGEDDEDDTEEIDVSDCGVM
ncbi:hypothetical protein OIV83_003874 [Microbotryomycetes sp. JL201]|nr:hypothetical protein OIV83_003874 [Microbotryomycetes sp. JL201]